MSSTNLNNLLVTRPDGEFTVAQPDDRVLLDSLQELQTEADSFLIFERSQYDYLQIARTDDDAYYVDYRDSESGPNYFVERQPLREASSILLDYVHGRDFKRNLPWSPFESSGSGPDENNE